MIRKIIAFFDKEITAKDALFIGAVSSIFSLLRLPSLIEPYWYGDEGIYQVIGMALRRGRLLYEGIWDNKPPLLYIIYAIFDGDLFYIRLLALFFGLASILVFFLLSKKLFKNSVSVYLATSFYAVMFAIPVLEGNIANAENFMHLPILLAFYLVFISSKKKSFIPIAFSGVLLSFAFLIKIVGIFDLAALVFALFTLRFYENVSFTAKNIKTHIKKLVLGIEQETVLIVSFIVPILLTSAYFFLEGAFPDFYKAVFSQNVGYVGHGNFLIIPMGLLFLKLFLLVSALLIVIKYRRIFNPSGVLILMWLAFSLYGTLFSQRPYTHYLLMTLPAFSLLLGYIIDNKKLMRITIPLLLVVLFIIFSNFRLNFKKAPSYYLNYLEFISGAKQVERYQSFFDRNTPRDYAIAEFIRSKTAPNESVFLWSDSGQIYALSGKLPPGRYIVSYHITFYPEAIEETKKALEETSPKYIIQTKNTPQINNFLDNYTFRYKMDGVNIYEREN